MNKNKKFDKDNSESWILLIKDICKSLDLFYCFETFVSQIKSLRILFDHLYQKENFKYNNIQLLKNLDSLTRLGFEIINKIDEEERKNRTTVIYENSKLFYRLTELRRDILNCEKLEIERKERLNRKSKIYIIEEELEPLKRIVRKCN